MNHSTRPTASPKPCDPLQVVHPDAAGIDIGSREHYVAVPPGRDAQPVRVFGCTTPDLLELMQWLKQCGVKTVALESTGVYWVPVTYVLEQAGIDIYLVDARQVRALPGRKTDVQDCQWLQQLHTMGLLARAFRPAADIQPLRTLWRHRAELVRHCAEQIHLMHKALEQMNVQLHKVLSDVTGLTGLRILRALVDGQRDPEYLVRLCHPCCKQPKQAFIKALTANYRPDQMFVLAQSMKAYDFYQQQLRECDAQIQTNLDALPAKAAKEELAQMPDRKRRDKKRRKNQTDFDLRAHLFALTGTDLTQIEGIDASTAFTIITEQGVDMDRFPTEKHFASHLGLCPNHRITGGRVKRRRTRNVASRAATALRVAAQSLHWSNGALGAFYRRKHARLGAPKAITATAHKLAKLIYRLLKYGQAYVHQGQDEYEQRQQEQEMKNLAKRARKIGCEITNLQTGEVLS
jgi:transposase